jgi:hypothetical protein
MFYRAYNTLGHATRHAIALGLHLTVTDPSVIPLDRLRRAMAWYALYSLEVLLGEILGRPTSVSISNVTIPISIFEKTDKRGLERPTQPDERTDLQETKRIWVQFLKQQREGQQRTTDSPMPWTNSPTAGEEIPASHFPYRLRLCHLSDKIGTQLYTGRVDHPWSEIQRRIREIQTELRQWLEALPTELAFHSDAPSGAVDPRVQLELSMYYQSVQMMLHRPCLCDVEIAGESHSSQAFNRDCASACVHAAVSMIASLPDNPDEREAYQLLPWWTLLHYLAQATSVLLLELSLDAQHLSPNETGELVRHLKKAMAYLRCLTEGSLSAYRLWRMLRQLLNPVRTRYGDLDVADIPDQAPEPVGWTEADENGIMNAFSFA